MPEYVCQIWLRSDGRVEEGGGGGYRQADKWKPQLYIVDSVLTCRQRIINSSASAPLNATKIAVKKVSDVDVFMFGREL